MTSRRRRRNRRIRISGFGKTRLRSGLLRPIRTTLRANAPGFTKKDWKYLRGKIRGFASDGKITRKEQVKLRRLLAMSTGQAGFSNSEGWLAEGAIFNQFSDIRYDNFIDRQESQNDDFLNRQNEALADIRKEQEAQIRNQLGSLSSQASSSLSAYQSLVNQAMAQGAGINAEQRAEFERQNAASESAIKQFQSRIATLPGYDEVDQISADFEKAVGMDAFEKLGRQMNPTILKRDPTTTGFSREQQASTSRQQQGIQGFRSTQVA